MRYLFIAVLYWPIWRLFVVAGHGSLGIFVASVVVFAGLCAQSKYDYGTWKFWKLLKDEL